MKRFVFAALVVACSILGAASDASAQCCGRGPFGFRRASACATYRGGSCGYSAPRRSGGNCSGGSCAVGSCAGGVYSTAAVETIPTPAPVRGSCVGGVCPTSETTATTCAGGVCSVDGAPFAVFPARSRFFVRANSDGGAFSQPKNRNEP